MSNLSAIFIIITLFISLILPPAFLIVYALRNKKQGIWSAWLLGALGFAAFSTLFESGGRYIFCMAPVFILLAACALLGQDTKKGEGCA